jgi:hypothetical protein
MTGEYLQRSRGPAQERMPQARRVSAWVPRLLSGVPRLSFWVAYLLVAAMASAQTAPPAANAPSKPVKTKVDGEEMYAVGFDTLARFDYEVVDAATGASEAEMAAAKQRDQIPGWVRVYDGKRVALTGFMMPLKMENGLSTKLIMMRDITTCCYGNVPNMNEYVIVTMKGPGLKPIQDVPVVLTGTFRIAEKYENGYLSSIFQMDGEKFLGPKK